jgi:RHS repeat-associated protein
LQDDDILGFKLNLYDYGARNYDPALGRWMNIDPLSESFLSHGPYSFCFNDPMRFVDSDGKAPTDIVYFDKNGVELKDKRIVSNTEFKTYVANDYWNSSFSEAPMPGKITYSLDGNTDPSSDKYNKYDYDIAAATYIINQGIKDESLSVGTGYTVGKKATELDVNLVKSLAYKESRLGQGASVSTKASDIFSMFNMGDYGDKGKMGMTKSDVKKGKGASSSTQWATKWLYYKGFKSNDGKTKDFQGWDYAVKKYGSGSKEKDYKETVFKIYNSINDGD